MKILSQIFTWPFIILIKLYQWILSPMLGGQCKFTPSCSCYAEEAFKKYGPLKGIILSIKRILKCHPWGTGGYDPVS